MGFWTEGNKGNEGQKGVIEKLFFFVPALSILRFKTGNSALTLSEIKLFSRRGSARSPKERGCVGLRGVR